MGAGVRGGKRQGALDTDFEEFAHTLAINVMANHVFLLLARPDGVGRTAEVAYLLAHPDSIAASTDPEGDIDALLAFPSLLLAIGISAVLGPGAISAALASIRAARPSAARPRVSSS